MDLNEPYLQINIDQMKEGKTDYLAIMGPPEAVAPSIPNYVNSQNLPNSDGNYHFCIFFYFQLKTNAWLQCPIIC